MKKLFNNWVFQLTSFLFVTTAYILLFFYFLDYIPKESFLEKITFSLLVLAINLAVFLFFCVFIGFREAFKKK